MTIQQALTEGHSILHDALLETPYLDATVLLAEALSCTKERLFVLLYDEIGESVYRLYRNYLTLRLEGYPVSYIRQKKEFFSLDFLVDERVFVPRPDTELLVESALEILKEMKGETLNGKPVRVHDCCTGTGCIAITLKHRVASLEVSASDVSTEAAEVFRLNSKAILGMILPFTVSDLMQRVSGPFDLIVSNPPYLTTDVVQRLKAGGWPEPEIALSGGEDGLVLEERLIEEAAGRLNPRGWLLLEADPDQMLSLSHKMRVEGFEDVRLIRDLAGKDRAIRGRVAA
jgi:release factor glutamine methyltransferase